MDSLETVSSKVSACLTWTFPDIRSKCGVPQQISSGPFSFKDFGFLTAKQNWTIKPHFDDKACASTNGERKFVGMYLQLNEGVAEQKTAVFNITFNVYIPNTGTWKGTGGPFESLDFRAGSCWGSGSAISHADLLAEPSEYLFAGALTVRVDMDFEVNTGHQCHLTHRLRVNQLYLSKEFVDFTLISSDKKEFHVHRLILAAHSSVFRSMFDHDTTEQQNARAEIDDVDGETLEVLLAFIYSGDLTKVAGLVEKVLAAADKYDISDLRDFCVRMLLMSVTVHLLTVGDQRGLAQLSKAASKVILDNASAFRQTEEFQQLKETNALFFNMVETFAEEGYSKARSG